MVAAAAARQLTDELDEGPPQPVGGADLQRVDVGAAAVDAPGEDLAD